MRRNEAASPSPESSIRDPLPCPRRRLHGVLLLTGLLFFSAVIPQIHEPSGAYRTVISAAPHRDLALTCWVVIALPYLLLATSLLLVLALAARSEIQHPPGVTGLLTLLAPALLIVNDLVVLMLIALPGKANGWLDAYFGVAGFFLHPGIPESILTRALVLLGMAIPLCPAVGAVCGRRQTTRAGWAILTAYAHHASWLFLIAYGNIALRNQEHLLHASQLFLLPVQCVAITLAISCLRAYRAQYRLEQAFHRELNRKSLT